MGSTLDHRIMEGFSAVFGGKPEFVARAPGRVNLIGEHTDYNDGFAMPLAIDSETRAGFRSGGQSLEVAALDFGEVDAFSPNLEAGKAGGWRDYVRGVVAELNAAGIRVPGGQLAIAGDIAKGTGLSSSASLEVVVATILLAAAGEMQNPLEVALLAQRAECDFVGVRCGNLDQIASAATESGNALLIDCRSLALTQVPIPAEAAVMIVQSGVVRGLVDGEYNLRRSQCEQAARAIGVPALRDADEAALERVRGTLDATSWRRARHVVTENRRVLEAAAVLAAGDLGEAGRLMRESHRSQAEDFGITVEATDRLVGILDGAIGEAGGARQTGGGFGGAVVALLPKADVDRVRQAVLAEYRTPDGSPPEIMVVTPAAGAGIVEGR